VVRPQPLQRLTWENSSMTSRRAYRLARPSRGGVAILACFSRADPVELSMTVAPFLVSGFAISDDSRVTRRVRGIVTDQAAMTEGRGRSQPAQECPLDGPRKV
jgi:hypothetical protein